MDHQNDPGILLEVEENTALFAPDRTKKVSWSQGCADCLVVDNNMVENNRNQKQKACRMMMMVLLQSPLFQKRTKASSCSSSYYYCCCCSWDEEVLEIAVQFRKSWVPPPRAVTIFLDWVARVS